MASAQASLFAEQDLGLKPYVPNPQHVRNRLQSLLDEMRSAAHWPWSASRVRFFRETVWPQLYDLLSEEEAARWRADMEAEAARLDSTALSATAAASCG